VVATLGVLIAADRTHWELLVVPLLWCAISGATLWAMQSPDAWLTPTAALLALVLACWKTFSRLRKLRRPEVPVPGCGRGACRLPVTVAVEHSNTVWPPLADFIRRIWPMSGNGANEKCRHVRSAPPLLEDERT
jgi:hypothetical protein